MMEEKRCVLEDRVCTNCGECERCDLDPNKKCDNCMKCITGDAEYRAILIDGFRMQKEFDREQAQESSSDDGLDWGALLEGMDT